MTLQEKINIAELLKDCPTGTELDCTMFDGLELDHIKETERYPIICRAKCYDGRYNIYAFDKYGHWNDYFNAKCVIFPKGKTSWEDFHRPFKDADIVAATIFTGATWVGIFKRYINNKFESYCFISANGVFNNRGLKNHSLQSTRLATEEEKQKFFQAIKDNGYHWNEETKTLEKLIEPKFKVGDRIVKRDSIINSWIVSSVSSEYYGLKLPNGIECIGVLPVSEQDNYELPLNTDKFDITTLKSFESKVLVRNCNSDYWKPAIFGFTGKDKNAPFCVEGGNFFNKCIPYEGNEHLLKTKEDCDKFYKTWE